MGLANNTTTTFHTIQGDAGTGGWLSGTIVIDATTDYVIPFFCFFDRQRDGTTYNVTAQFGDSIPAGLSITNSGSSVQVVMPNNASFVSASVTYAVQAAANGTTLPVSVSASSVLGSTSGVAPAAGVIGERITGTLAEASGITLTTSTYTDITSISLTPGTWSITATAEFAASGSNPNNTLTLLAIATASGNSSTGIISGVNRTSLPLPPVSGANMGLSIPSYVVTIASNTNYYAKAVAVFTSGGNKVWGEIRAIRIG
jgi:hypothetical protein